MTVYESLARWLNGLLAEGGDDGIPEGTEAVTDAGAIPSLAADFPGIGAVEAGLYGNPGDRSVDLLGGHVRRTEHRTWYVARRFGEFEDRRSNERFVEAVRNRIRRAALRGDMPGDGRRWRRIEVSGGMFPSSRSADGRRAVYQIPLRIEYVE